MAESKFAPMNADERGGAATGDIRLNMAAANPGPGPIIGDQYPQLSQALVTASIRIDALTTAIDS